MVLIIRIDYITYFLYFHIGLDYILYLKEISSRFGCLLLYLIPIIGLSIVVELSIVEESLCSLIIHAA